jgi:hypothetical protein
MDGQVIGQETAVISPGGKTLAVIYYAKAPTGKEATVIAIFEKK